MQTFTWQSSEFNGVLVDKIHEMGGVKEIRIRLEKGAVMKEHKAPGAIMVQVLRGEIDFSVNENLVKLNELDMITLDANVPHSLLALKDSIVRLSLSKNDDVSRVFGVLKS
ncbi:cupin domain-containing protein [Campylobacter gastrosuis]|uniref:Cupin domain-containing protein n=1 Tax=Campylobacter gastrosuis TaxID=2974576 RepID=A0ABT7HRY2_9BACT|nr:cupin domain-containing protein [Campylobacter gastrosuis]MDL0089669.1 cupin domain-containing protein [Campylobacter gastrosuis]